MEEQLIFQGELINEGNEPLMEITTDITIPLELTSNLDTTDLAMELISGPLTTGKINYPTEEITELPLNVTSEPLESTTDILVKSHSESGISYNPINLNGELVTPPNGIESNETIISTNYTTKESDESTTFRDNFITREGNMTTMSGDISDYVYKMTPAPDGLTNQVDEITDITNYVPIETTTATPFSGENLLDQTNKVTNTHKGTLTVPEEDTNSTVVENTTKEYGSRTENTTDRQYTTELEITTPTGYTVESENTTTTTQLQTLNLENITTGKFSVSSGLMSPNRTTWKYLNYETTSSTELKIIPFCLVLI